MLTILLFIGYIIGIPVTVIVIKTFGVLDSSVDKEFYTVVYALLWPISGCALLLFQVVIYTVELVDSFTTKASIRLQKFLKIY